MTKDILIFSTGHFGLTMALQENYFNTEIVHHLESNNKQSAMDLDIACVEVDFCFLMVVLRDQAVQNKYSISLGFASC